MHQFDLAQAGNRECPGARSAVDFHAVGELSLFDQEVEVTLREVGGIGADVPVIFEGQRAHARLGGVDRDLDHGGCMRLKSGVIVSAFDSLKVLFEPFEDRFHNFICPLPIHVEVYAAF